MKQSLQLRMGQSLKMTPQLQQAIRFLQLSTLDLQQEIQQALDSNMMLEVDEESVVIVSEDNSEQESVSKKEIGTEGSQTDVPDELPTDSNWDDVFESSAPASPLQPEKIEFELQYSRSETLFEYLYQQLAIISISDRDKAIAVALIDSINSEGYICDSIEAIYQGLQSQLEDLELDEVEAVLHRVQNFDPVGIAARDLSDCLTIQLNHLPENTPFRQEALDLVQRHLDLLAKHDQATLIRRLGLSPHQLAQAITLIRTLNPQPGAKMQDVSSEYIVPDVFVKKYKGVWQVSLNPDVDPKLRVNAMYSKMIKRADNSPQNVSMKEHLQEARWFIKSLHSRNDTLLRVAESILDKQQAFFEHGEIAMKPLVLREIAEELELHESTISRITTQKYMHMPNGIVEFKHFFSSHVSTVEGGECSSTAIRAFIKELVESENSAKPLSDNKMSHLLKEKGINIARRTIAKYREAMSIPSSSQRKRLL